MRIKRQELKVEPSYKRVDTCAAEFEAATPYMYSSYDGECESMPTDKPKVLILGGGPNRIGQGIEFDYCCCHASFALRYFHTSTSILLYLHTVGAHLLLSRDALKLPARRQQSGQETPELHAR